MKLDIFVKRKVDLPSVLIKRYLFALSYRDVEELLLRTPHPAVTVVLRPPEARKLGKVHIDRCKLRGI